MAMMMCTCQLNTNLHPLILVPGNGGNQLEARLTKAYKPPGLICKLWSHRSTHWFRLWFDPTVLVGPLTKCFSDRMTLHYDPEKDDYFNTPGVETRVPHFGSTQSLLYLNPELKHITGYMAPLVKSLEQQGYRDGENLYGAPYDFRYGLAPEGHPSFVGTEYLHNLKNLIEKASASNGGKPVIVLSHSLGSLFVLQLLNRSSATWCYKFIKHFIALSAPWGGTVQEMLTFASGYSLGVPLVDPLLVRDEQRSSESNLWLLPSPKLFRRKTPLVITETRNYSASDIPQFLDDIRFSQGVQPYKTRILPLTKQLLAPGVPVTCIIGTGIKTPETLFYGKDGFDKQPDIIYGDGDGTVNLLSLLALEKEWSAEPNQSLKVIKIPQVSHTSILKDDVALRQIVTELSDINSNVLISVS
ncbi:Phosphatidylcholine-sterol acyltransferase [Thalictrum thalictroides]|uniref:Phosphatidylcholine-sterol acyltransferase n=1 Tax=Thalictrum thalictroides TaxID=46969 RepID=A0A7J6X895_THATH|nr:Phosphatidylcholine-sterol acyltransferase [Thalictrum thalictroides]